MSLSLLVNLACVWEATARKPGNVHRFADFDDVLYVDFLTSAAASAPILGTASERPVGETILSAVQATRQVVRSNTNLGILLLLAPLAAVPEGEPLVEGVERILGELTVADSRLVFEAIRQAQPGGLGKAPEQDVQGEPTLPLRAVMAFAQERDLIARQYANGFREVFAGVSALACWLLLADSLEAAIIHLQLHLLGEHPDSLIARKCGLGVAQEASRRARTVLEAGWPGAPDSVSLLAEFDAWLRADGHRRNPGTTADLVTACLFAALRLRIIAVPPPWPWSST